MLSSGSADTLGAVGVEGCSSGGVDIGVTDARRAVSRGVTQNSTNTCYLATWTPRVSEFSVANKTMLRKDGLHVKKEEEKGFGMRREGYFHGAHRHTHTSIHWLSNQALKTTRLSVTIWKNLRRNRRARFGGLASVLSVPWKSASFGRGSGGSRRLRFRRWLLSGGVVWWGGCSRGVWGWLPCSWGYVESPTGG